ncbi:Increased DNA methylation 1 [Camellia lanceoleosa]|uniref:Increased DNA methylation 1 n=1 Tax=Camellia lanceoleosa TaxID=1840588 RepID=A0ACC0HSJ1_9ERIC|nr:Increased DNA methylation 1 [Camellia lanceoleosa]
MVKAEKRHHINVPGMHHATRRKKTAEGRTKKRDNDLHRLLFMPNELLDGAKLAYYSKGQVVFSMHSLLLLIILGGYEQGNGIVCSCCHTEFEAHTGWSARRQLYRNIYTSSELTLHDIALSLANGQNLATGSSDDMCVACGAGGDQIICDGCPRAFHICHGLVCEKEYHVGYLRDSGLYDLKELPRDKWFCCDDYNRIHVALQNLVLVGAEMISASVSYAIHRKHIEKGFTYGVSNDTDLLPPLIYLTFVRNIFRQEFGGMYCVVLIVKSVVVSVGLLRIFGREVAELPLVATCRENQGKGYFQALFSCIESLLYSLNVENLVLPAAEEAESI